MKSLAILDNDSLDQAFGGVSRAVSPGQLAQSPRGSSLDIKQLASDFGFGLPNELASSLDSVEGLVGQLTSGADANSALGCTMDTSGAGAYDAAAADAGAAGCDGAAGEEPYDAAGDAPYDDAADAGCDAAPEPPACEDPNAAPETEIAADGETCGTMPPGGSWDEEPAAEVSATADIEPAGAASASGGVTIGASIDRGGSSGGWFDIDAGFAQYADASQPAPLKSSPSFAGAFDDAELEPAATDRPYSSFAESANVRDHRGR